MAKASSNTFTHKLGKTRAGEGTRIWLEGQRLIDHGFTHGVLFARDWNDTRDILTITLCTPEEFNALPRDARGRVSGSAARPVIDIVGQHVAQMFPGGTIAATWSPNRITIKGASNDH